LTMMKIVGVANAGPILPGSTGDAFTGDPFVLNFDENGNATVSVNGGPFTALHGTLMTNPSNIGLPGLLALTYLLPEIVVNGDVGIGNAIEGRSDGLRFTDAAGNLTGFTANRLIYYSDLGLGDLDLADTGFPTNFPAGFTVTESGVENALETF